MPPFQTYSTDRSKAVVPVLVLLALWFILRGDMFYVLLCFFFFFFFFFFFCFFLFFFVPAFFSPFSIAITSLGEERASFVAFRMFV